MIFRGLIFLIFAFPFANAATPEISPADATLTAEKANSERCAECHSHIFHSLKYSDKGKHHFFANEKVGKFNNALSGNAKKSFQKGNEIFSFFKNGDGCGVEVKSGNVSEFFAVEMLIGKYPLRQPVVEIEKGKFQTLPVAENADTHALFDVFHGDSRQKDDWGHWRKGGMNWNSQCAYCHMSGFKKKYDPKSGSYNSIWIEQGIRCVQCHADIPSACVIPSPKKTKYKRGNNAQLTEMCAICHSLREQITADEFKSGDSYFDHFRPTLPDNSEAYYQDGKVKSESFMFTSFMQSRQYDAGISCNDCHDVHSLKLFAPPENNKLCLGCHRQSAHNKKNAPAIDVKKHTRHDERGGDKCIECHMPSKTFMGIDNRRDHGFTSPDPYLTLKLGIPNACSECHEKIDGNNPKRNLKWLIGEFEKRHSTPLLLQKRKRAIALSNFQNGKFSAKHFNDILELFKIEKNPVWKSVLIKAANPYAEFPETDDMLRTAIKDKHPLVRNAAIALAEKNIFGKEYLNILKSDNSRLVRIDAAIASRSKDFPELETYLDFNSDSPIGALRKSRYLLPIKESEKSVREAERAIRLAPNDADIAIHSAIVFFQNGEKEKAEKTFKYICGKFADNAYAHFIYSLFLQETSRPKDAIAELEKSLEIDGNNSRVWYNLSIAYLKCGMKRNAYEAIMKALALDKKNPAYLKILGLIENK